MDTASSPEALRLPAYVSKKLKKLSLEVREAGLTPQKLELEIDEAGQINLIELDGWLTHVFKTEMDKYQLRQRLSGKGAGDASRRLTL